MRRLLFILFVLCGPVVSAQNPDSISFVRASWQKKKVAPATRLTTHHFADKTLFLANQNISYLTVKNNGRRMHIALGAEEKKLQKTSDFGKQAGAIAAINGTFFDIKNGGSVDFIKVNGNIVNPTRLEKGGKRARHQRAALVIKNGIAQIKKWGETEPWEATLTENDVLLSGPLLTYNGMDQKLDTTAFTRSRHPRSCVGLKPNGQLILLTVDGRNENSAGMSLHELTQIMRWLGCSTVMNLDGGGSTTLWLRTFAGNGVVNYPTDNKKWDHAGERNVANVILLKKP